jgi:hypothetical protein
MNVDMPVERHMDQPAQSFAVPLIIRGKLIEAHAKHFAARQGDVRFAAPDVTKFIDRLVTQPSALQDLYRLKIDEIVDFLARVGRALDLAHNTHLQEAYEVSRLTSGISTPILKSLYQGLPSFFGKDMIARFVETQIGARYLEDWVEVSDENGIKISVRAFGARGVHIIAGNSPAVAFATVLRSAITRSDTIIKLPSNDPLTATAIARTMIDIDPDHPVTRHISVAYWKGGDDAVEARLYHPRNVEKIVAWGGFDSVKHITKYMQPGIDLITLDPKHSASIIGKEALADEQTMRTVAGRAAVDIGAFNQETCANARVIYVECDPDDPAQMDRLNTFGRYVFEALQGLSQELSTPAKYVVPELQEEIQGLVLQDQWYRVFHKDEYSGAIIVSQTDEAVSFAQLLACRTANLVPVATLQDALKRVSAATQTIGVYPETLQSKIRDRLGLQGAQHIIPLGAITDMGMGGPQDGLEAERRMLKWVKEVTISAKAP